MSHETDDTVIYPGLPIRFPRAAIIAVCVLAAVASGALIAWRVSPRVSPPPPAVLRVVNCGAAVFSGAGLNAEPPGALRCFGAAARRCKAGSIKVTEMGIDAGTYYWFTIESGGDGCQATELRQNYTANGGGAAADPVTSTHCRVAAVTGAGVTLSCDGQDLLIPASACVAWTSGCELVLSADSRPRAFRGLDGLMSRTDLTASVSRPALRRCWPEPVRFRTLAAC